MIELLFMCKTLTQDPLAVLEGFSEVVGFNDVSAVKVGDGSGQFEDALANNHNCIIVVMEIRSNAMHGAIDWTYERSFV